MSVLYFHAMMAQMSEVPRTTIQIGTGTLFRAVFVVLFILALLYLRDVVLVVLASVVIASAIEPFILSVIKRGISRVIAVLSTYIVLSVMFVAVFYFFVPSLLSDTANFLRQVPEVLEVIPNAISLPPESVREGASFAESLSRDISQGDSVVRELSRPSSFSSAFVNVSQILSSFSEGFWDNVSVVFGGVVSFMLIIVLSFYLAVQEDGVGKFLRVVTPQSREAYVIGLWKRSQRKIGLWLQGQILLAVLVGLLVYLGLTVLGVKNALFLAALAGILEIIPLFGPILSAIPAVALAYAQGGISLFLLVGGLYVIIQQFENHLIYPLVVKKIVGVPPMLVILAIIVGGKLAGFLGIILSVPVAATLVEYFDDMQRRKAATT
ncbi:MAG: AI-2E family transporter [bacterium]|nr:AI-2E family transporter [bacterium]